MKTLSQYRDDIKNLMKKVADIDSQATNESRDLTSQEIVLKNEIFDQIEELKATVATMERQERVASALEAPSSAVTIPQKAQSMTSGTISAGRSQDKFNSLGEQLASVMKAGRPGGNVDPRLFNAATGLNETVSSDGGLR